MEAARAYALLALGSAKASRIETRLRPEGNLKKVDENLWFYYKYVEPYAHEWRQTILPAGGKRMLGVRHANKFYLFGRKDPANVFHGSRVCKEGPDFVCDCVGYLIYDLIAREGMSMVHLPLSERIKRAPVDSIFSVADYEVHQPQSTRTKGRRLILIRENAPYSDSKSAYSWKPRPAVGTAVLCCRSTYACSLIDGSGYMLKEEGPVTGAAKHMTCYLCKWQGNGWQALREAKASEPVCPTSRCASHKVGGPPEPDLPFY